jgi:transcriptional regulator with XRE-family HTH domain
MDINDLYRDALKKLLQEAKTQKVSMKAVYAESEITASAVSQFLSGKTQTLQLDTFTRLFKALGVDILQFVLGGGNIPSADPAAFLDLAMVGRVEAGATNGTVDIEIHDEDLKHWEGPVISVARDLLKKGLRGQSLQNIIALTIHGDSMMPVFQEGDHVFLKKTHDLNHIHHKDIVVMDTDGQGSYTIKMWDKAGVLVPLNPKHDVIPLSQCSNPRLYGRAIGLERVL